MSHLAQIKFGGRPKKKGYPSGTARFRANPVPDEKSGNLTLSVLSPAWCLAVAGCKIHEPKGISKRTKLVHMVLPNGSNRSVTVPVKIPDESTVKALAAELRAKDVDHYDRFDEIWPYGYRAAHVYKTQTRHIRFDSDDETVTERETPWPAEFTFGELPIISLGKTGKTPVKIRCVWDDDGQATWTGLEIYLPGHVVTSKYPEY